MSSKRCLRRSVCAALPAECATAKSMGLFIAPARQRKIGIRCHFDYEQNCPARSQGLRKIELLLAGFPAKETARHGRLSRAAGDPTNGAGYGPASNGKHESPQRSWPEWR